FRRPSAPAADTSPITGQVTELALPAQLEEISSTRIRDAIDQGRDISNLIDPVAQEFIYRHGLYLREPPDKPLLRREGLSFSWPMALAGEGEEAVRALLPSQEEASKLLQSLCETGDRLCLLRREEQGPVLGFISFQCLESHQFFPRLGSAELSGF